MRYFQSELKKHDADDWEYEKKPDEKSSFSELADKTVKSSLSSSSRGAGSTSTSNT